MDYVNWKTGAVALAVIVVALVWWYAV